jgi:8-oxo-dGTP pyrophosphatase MutT (NUDIX family)
VILDFTKLEIYKLKEDSLHTYIPNDVRGATVIIPIFINNNNQHSVILTKRSHKLKNHPGQISFPGGTLNPNEGFLDAGLREWEEELGSPANSLEILGNFGFFHTFTGFSIFPYLTIYKGNFEFKPNTDEVEKVIYLDLEEFYTRPFYAIPNIKNSGKKIYYLHTHEDILWGATAEILVDLITKLGEFQRKPILVTPNIY